MPISHVTSLQGTTAVLPCDVASTSGWVGFASEMFFVLFLVFFFLFACVLFLVLFIVSLVFYLFCILCFLILLPLILFLVLLLSVMFSTFSLAGRCFSHPMVQRQRHKANVQVRRVFLPTYNHKTTIRYEEKKFCFHDVCNTICSFMFQVWAASSLPSSVLCGGWLSLIWSLVNNWFTLYIRWAVPRRETPQKTLTF